MIRRWLTKIAKLTLRLTLLTVAAALLTSAIFVAAAYAPALHTDALREYVGSRVYYIRSPNPKDQYMGTAFLLKGSKGKSYIVTNDHLCDGEVKGRVLISKTKRGKPVSMKILERSKTSDLCLIEGFKNTEGLSMGPVPYTGQTIYSVGHPALKPMTINSGQINGLEDVEIPDETKKIEDCTLPKHKKTTKTVKVGDKQIQSPVCEDVTRSAYITNVIIFPGSSGSPVVDHFGRVLGVVFATDGTHWAFVVSHADLKQLMRNR